MAPIAGGWAVGIRVRGVGGEEEAIWGKADKEDDG